MSPIPKFVRDAHAWDDAKKKPGEINANLAFYRFFELGNVDPKTKAGLEFMMKIDLERQCAHMFTRQAQQIKGLKAQGWEADHWVQVTHARMACGLGIPHPSDNGLLLDRVSGAPYLPGTGLKGLARDLAREELEDIQGEERKAAEAVFLAVFGADPSESSEGSRFKGYVHFFDAFPDVMSSNGKRPFQVDIINPHYGDYYASKGRTSPADYLAPNPSYFLTVRREIPFGFALAVRVPRHRGGETVGTPLMARQLLAKARTWLQTALMELGAGGKTRVGYGIFGSPLVGGSPK